MGDVAGLDIVVAGAFQPLAKAFKARRRGVEGENSAAVAHVGGHCQGFAAGAGAKIANLHPRPGANQSGGHLAALVLNLKMAVFKSRQAVDGAAFADTQPIWRQRRWLGRHSLIGEHGAERRAVGARGVDP